MLTTPNSRSSAARMTRHRERRRRGTRCLTVDVSQSERDALVVRGYLAEHERGSGVVQSLLGGFYPRLEPMAFPSVEAHLYKV